MTTALASTTGPLPALASTAPTGPLSSPWPRSVLALEAASKGPVSRGKLPRPLTDEERSWILARATSLLPHVVEPKVDPDAAVQTVTMLIVGLGGASEDATTAALKAQAYRAALAEVPLWAVKSAVNRWLRGEVGDVLPGVDVSWAPKPAQIRAVAMAVFAWVRSEYDRLQKLSAAEVDPHARKPTGPNPIPPVSGALAGERIPTPELRSMVEAARPQAKPMPDAERRLIEALAAGATITDDMIEAAERAHG
jgi:hypothetical protein